MKGLFLKTQIYLVFCLLIGASRSHGTEKAALETKLSATIEIVVKDTAILNEGEMEIKLYQNGINTTFTLQTKLITIKLNKPTTKIVIPLSTSINYGTIDLTYKNQSKIYEKRLFYISNNTFIFENGDHIEVMLDQNKVQFSGKGSEKFNCLYEASKHQDIQQSQFKQIGKYRREKKYSEFFAYSKQVQDSLYNLKGQIVDKYAKSISRAVSDLIRTDIWAIYNSKIIETMFGNTTRFGTRYGEDHMNAVETAYQDYLENYQSDLFPDQILLESLRYCDALYWREYYAEQVLNRKNTVDPFTFRTGMIDKSYNGAIREKVHYLNSLARGKISEKMLDTYQEKKNTVINSKYQLAMRDLIKANTGKAFPFELKDSKGITRKLTDFRNKLIVMDFWYTGCINCVEQAKVLLPIIEGYKNNDKIVFVSISIDGSKNKQIWLKSIEKGIYTGKDEINLIAEGKNDELIKHYNIQGYPKLILISAEGNVITTNPPDPREEPLEFKALIDANI